MSSQTYRLTLAHQRLDEAIRTEGARLWPDSIRLLRLKKLKLAKKDAIERLARGQRPTA